MWQPLRSRQSVTRAGLPSGMTYASLSTSHVIFSKYISKSTFLKATVSNLLSTFHPNGDQVDYGRGLFFGSQEACLNGGGDREMDLLYEVNGHSLRCLVFEQTLNLNYIRINTYSETFFKFTDTSQSSSNLSAKNLIRHALGGRRLLTD
jgi:hypothetical protein